MKRDLFREKPYTVLFALITMFAWGCAFPTVKLGMAAFDVSAADVGGKMLFAGIRFFIAGVVTLCVARTRGCRLMPRSGREVGWLALYAAVNTGLHYYCFYSGLSRCTGSKGSIIDAFNTFELILLACLIYRERMTLWKGIGCVLGLAGIIVTNLGGDMSGGFRLEGEGMMLLASLCAAFGGILVRPVSKRTEVITATGWGLLGGGAMLLLGGFLAGGRIARVTPQGLGILACLVAISSVAFVLYNRLLSVNPMSEIAIYNALIPCFGTLMSFLLLGEAIRVQNLIGLALIVAGIWAVNARPEKC